MAELTGRAHYRRTLLLCAAPGVVIAAVGLAVTPFLAGLGLLVAVGGPIAYYLTLRSKASAQAKDEVMHRWAQEHGWEYQPSPALPGDVAFCRDKQRMVASDGFAGQMCEVPGLIFNFTYSTFETRTRTDSQGNVSTYTEEVKHRHTVLRLQVGAVEGIDSLQLANKGIGFLERLQAAFGPSRRVETESVEFNKRFALTVNDGADGTAVLRVFTPALLVRLINGEFPQTTFQYERGSLAYVWGDQYDVEDLEEIESRVAAVDPLTSALRTAVAAIR
jgi:hypothetical protein